MKKICFVLLFMVFFCSLSCAASVYEKKGNVYYVGDDKKVKQLTFSGLDREAALHPKGKWVYYIHSYPGKWVGEKYYPPKGKKVKPGLLKEELWRIKTDGTGTVRLFRCEYTGLDGPDLDYSVASISNIQFSPKGDKVYFETPQWATSAGLHVMDPNGKYHRFLGAGNDTRIILSSERKDDNNKDYSGYIITDQHRYWMLGGSYDWYYLFTPDFKEVGALGEDPKYFTEMGGIKYTDHSEKKINGH